MIWIILIVTLFYTVWINEDNIVILLSNSYMFSVTFVLFSLYFSFHSITIIQFNWTHFLKINGTIIQTWYQSLLRQATSLSILHCTLEAAGFPHKSRKACIVNSGFVQKSLCGHDGPWESVHVDMEGLILTWLQMVFYFAVLLIDTM